MDKSGAPPTHSPTPAKTSQQAAEPVETPAAEVPVPVVEPAQEPVQPIAAPAIKAAPSEMAVLKARHFEQARVPIIGSVDKDSGYKLEVDLSAWGASILQIQLADYHLTARRELPYTILFAPDDPDSNSGKGKLFPFAAHIIWINQQAISLADVRWELISPNDYRTTVQRRSEDATRTVTGRAEYALTIVNDSDEPVVELRRTYILDKDSYQLQCRQQIINHTSESLDIQWSQRGYTDIVKEKISYMGDTRSLAAGYLDPEYDSSQTRIYTDDTWIERKDLLDKKKDIWPHEDLSPAAKIVWMAELNRYFALVIHPHLADDAQHAIALDSVFKTQAVEMRGLALPAEDRVSAILLQTSPFQLAPGKTHSIDLDLYAGPRKRDVFKTPPNDKLSLSQLIKYQMSAACAFCTFQWLAQFLLSFLELLHEIVFDWGVAIIILVVIVRGMLHPITKKSQVNMMVMQKQMAALQPEIEKLKKKYENDQQKLQQEQFKLMRERGVSFGGCMAMVPMFLQTPIWIALYAMLYLAIELRHEPAFYEIFHMMGGWEFLYDLSSPDAFYRFSETPVHINFPLLNMLDFSTFNILPFLWTVVMYFQQKLTMPPATTDQQAQQQKIMKAMTFLFPIMLYSAPSGLTLYILASTAASVLDSYIVRKYVKDREESGELLNPKSKKPPRKPKTGGFMDRMQKTMQEAQRRQQEQQKKKDGSSPRRKKRD